MGADDEANVDGGSCGVLRGANGGGGGGSVSAQSCPISYAMEYGTCEGYDTGTPPAVKSIAPLTTVAVVGQHFSCRVNGEAGVIVTNLSRCDVPSSAKGYQYVYGHNVAVYDDEGNFTHYIVEFLQPHETTNPIPPGTGPDRDHMGTNVIGPPDDTTGLCPIWYSMQHRTCDGYSP